ncbi:hypothetical protein GWK47_026168 [Chionoecetes opilio]|uniref:Uncharacterized protein n=1 Tax=Chionoecetes opilio TaxID=41210 RepID=A0A8J8WMX8_CHIOP|nr:hypothetical protein GWK47_026168 [Chionoecetes opilio]
MRRDQDASRDTPPSTTSSAAASQPLGYRPLLERGAWTVATEAADGVTLTPFSIGRSLLWDAHVSTPSALPSSPTAPSAPEPPPAPQSNANARATRLWPMAIPVRALAVETTGLLGASDLQAPR